MLRTEGTQGKMQRLDRICDASEANTAWLLLQTLDDSIVEDTRRTIVQQKLNDFSSTVLASAIEESLREFWRNWGRAPQSELYDDPNMIRLYTGVPFAFCNGVICSKLSPDNIDAGIDEMVSYFCARNATWEWIVGSNPTSASLENSLVKHNLFVHGEMIGMAINLHAMSKDIPSTDNLRIVPVDNNETMKRWANTMVEGFESPALYPTFVDLECSLGYQQQSYRRYLGLLDHQPVSTSALLLGEKVAGIYCVSTLSRARRLGIGATITLFALREAQAMGYQIAVLQSSQIGRNVYRQLGFQEFSTLRGYSPAK
jgi:ribosomal protein S18 acetylase RimI-like enzyme